MSHGICVAGPPGFEPGVSGSEGRRVLQATPRAHLFMGLREFKRVKVAVLILAILVESAVLLMLVGEIGRKNERIASLLDTVSQQDRVLRDLNERVRYLEQTVEGLEEDYNELFTRYLSLRNLCSDVNSVISWIEMNSRVNVEGLKRCKRGDRIVLPCVAVLNREMGIEYRRDMGDSLKPVEKTLKAGGDCEDIALLFAAEYRALGGYPVAAVEGKGNLVVYTEGDRAYYIEGARPVRLEGKNAYVVCGDFNGGHCVVAFCKERYRGGDLGFFDSCDFVEPQDGFLTAKPSQYYLAISENDLCTPRYCVSQIPKIIREMAPTKMGMRRLSSVERRSPRSSANMAATDTARAR